MIFHVTFETTLATKVRQHFADGETFGVYGEILPAQSARPGRYSIKKRGVWLIWLTRQEKKEEEKTPVTILTGSQNQVF